jgi:hypothetical protein
MALAAQRLARDGTDAHNLEYEDRLAMERSGGKLAVTTLWMLLFSAALVGVAPLTELSSQTMPAEMAASRQRLAKPLDNSACREYSPFHSKRCSL